MLCFSLFLGCSWFCWPGDEGRVVVGGLDDTGGCVGAGYWGGADASCLCIQ